jgi:ABC-type protease/lipase transport system fused ATPase/permease subunit
VVTSITVVILVDALFAVVFKNVESMTLPGRPVVEIRGLWSVFPGPARFGGAPGPGPDVQRGEVLSLVGGSGTGKTVLLRQILGLEHAGARQRHGAG